MNALEELANEFGSDNVYFDGSNSYTVVLKERSDWAAGFIGQVLGMGEVEETQLGTYYANFGYQTTVVFEHGKIVETPHISDKFYSSLDIIVKGN